MKVIYYFAASRKVSLLGIFLSMLRCFVVTAALTRRA